MRVDYYDYLSYYCDEDNFKQQSVLYLKAIEARFQAQLVDRVGRRLHALLGFMIF